MVQGSFVKKLMRIAKHSAQFYLKTTGIGQEYSRTVKFECLAHNESHDLNS